MVTGEVFISYSRSDRAYVEKLVAHLKGAGVPVWHDYQIATGERFERIIQRQLDACSAVVVLATPAAIASEWVELEIGYAKDHGKPILPLLRAGRDLPFRIRNLHYEDVTAGGMPSGAFVARLLHAHAHPPPPAQPTPPPIPIVRGTPPPGQRRPRSRIVLPPATPRRHPVPAAERAEPTPIPAISDVPPASHAGRTIPDDDLMPAVPKRRPVRSSEDDRENLCKTYEAASDEDRQDDAT